MNDEDIITIEGKALGEFVEAVNRGTVYRIRIWDGGDVIKFKLNEGMWTPPIKKEG